MKWARPENRARSDRSVPSDRKDRKARREIKATPVIRDRRV